MKLLGFIPGFFFICKSIGHPLRLRKNGDLRPTVAHPLTLPRGPCKNKGRPLTLTGISSLRSDIPLRLRENGDLRPTVAHPLTLPRGPCKNKGRKQSFVL